MDENLQKEVERQLELIRVVNEAIDRWTKRPHPDTPFYAVWKPSESKRNISEYWAGRFYCTNEVLETLSKHFGVEKTVDVFVWSHMYIYGAEATQKVRVFFAQIYADYEVGAKLPSFVLAVYVMLKKQVGL